MATLEEAFGGVALASAIGYIGKTGYEWLTEKPQDRTSGMGGSVSAAKRERIGNEIRSQQAGD